MSTPRRILSVLLPTLAALVVSAPAARAEVCGNVSAAGTCLDSKTLVWCAAGELKTLVCPTGEVCVAHERFGGSSGCIATQYTECGPITEAGQCAAGVRAVVWCDANRVRARECDEGLACAWVDEEGWYDCVPIRSVASNGPTTPDPDPPTDDETDVFTPPSDGQDEADHPTGPVPGVEKGGATARGTYAGGGGSCSGGEGPLGLWLAGLALGAWWWRRRRAPAR